MNSNPFIPLPEDRVTIWGLELNVAYGCNLKCEHCTHYGRYLQGIESVENLVLWSETWSRKIALHQLRIMGGEPLLHPQLDKILIQMKEIWSSTHLVLVSNILLADSVSSSVFDAIRETGIDVIASKHFDTPAYNSRYFEGVEIFRQHGIQPEIRRSDEFWFKCYRLDEDGVPEPYSSNPEKAWEHCFSKHRCIVLMHNRLYKCEQLACAAHAYRHGWFSEKWKDVLDYTPLSPECTPEEIREFMKEAPSAHCRICPEEFELIGLNEKCNVFHIVEAKKIKGDEKHVQ